MVALLIALAVSYSLAPPVEEGPINLLSNPSFENATYVCVREEDLPPGNAYTCSATQGVPVQEIDVPVGWTFAYYRGWISPYSHDYSVAQPEVRLIDLTYPARVADGGKALKVYTTWHNYAVVLSQAVRVDGPGTVWGCIKHHFWLSETDQGLAPNGNPLSEFRDGGQVCVAVIAGNSIVQECGFAVDEYADLCTSRMHVDGGEMVFRVTAGQHRACRNNDVYLDDARMFFIPDLAGYSYWAGITVTDPLTATDTLTGLVPVSPTVPLPTSTPTPAPTPSPTPPPTPTPSLDSLIEITPFAIPTALSGYPVGWRGFLVRPNDSTSVQPSLPTPTPLPTARREGEKTELPITQLVIVGGLSLVVGAAYLLRTRFPFLQRLFGQ